VAQLIKKPKTNLGPGFWPVTIFLAALAIVSDYYVIVTPLSKFLPEAAVPADQIDALFKFLTVVGNAIFIYVAGYVVYFSIAFRRPKNAPASTIGVQIHDQPQLEFWWTLIPTLLIVALAVFSIVIWRGLQQTQGDVLTMEAVGHQFYFEFRYPKLKASVRDEMHIPVNTPITLHVTATDVLHGFWVPEIRLKADMVPGLVNTLRFTPTKIGQYHVICTEFCGSSHGKMVAKLYIDSQQDFAKWFSKQENLAASGGGAGGGAAVALTSGQKDKGQALFGQKCSTCHSVGPYNQIIVGPGLGHLFNDAEHKQLVDGKDVSPESIAYILHNGYQGQLNGHVAVMPGQQANAISNEDIANLTAYLVSLSK